MKCIYCDALLEEDQTVCPVCGKAVAEVSAEQEVVPAETPETENAQEETVQDAVLTEDPNEVPTTMLTDEPAQEDEILTTIPDEEEASEPAAEEPVQKPKKKVWLLILGIVGSVAALLVLAWALLTAFGVQIKLPENNITRKDAYMTTDEAMLKKADVVVAQIADKELTNAQLQIFYRMQVQDFLNYYGSYLGMIGLDYTQPLSEQTCYFDETLTWEQYLLDISLQTWQNNQIMALLAEEAGFELDETYLAEFEKLPQVLEDQAAEGEFENAQAMIQEVLGPGVTVEAYLDYIEMVTLRNVFYSSEYERLMPTDAECEEYFTQNQAAFESSGVTMTSGLVSSVRHILVCPEGGTEDDTGVLSYSDAEWAACLAEAEKILEEWRNGEATEESFAALVATYTEDPGSASTGGLYTDVAPGSNYVENFLNWSIDMSRKPGDTGIVQTEFGYHIMYFVEGEAHWLTSARSMLLSERTNEMIDAAEIKWPMKVSYNKIVLSELKLA